MDKPIRVLHVVAAMNRGGAESFIMNVYREIDRKKIQFDFAVTAEQECHFDKEIKELGGKIIKHPNPSKYGINQFLNELKKTIINGQYRVIHSHVHNFSGFIMKLGKKLGVPVRLAHSHSTQDGKSNSLPRILYRWYTKKLILKYSTHLPGCSKAACEALFGSKCWEDKRTIVIPNAINIELYKKLYNVEDNYLREELQIPKNVPLIGHIGSFSKPKNHEFLIDIFQSYNKRITDSHLLLVGDGELKEQIVNLVKLKGLEKNVHFLGVRSDVPKILNSIDLLLFPSLYEGLPTVLVEAQTAGVPCVVSNTITREVDLGAGLIKFVDLDDNLNNWLSEINGSITIKRPEWNTRFYALQKHGFDLKKVISTLESIYV